MTIYHEFDKRLANSDRESIIRNGYGSVRPAIATKYTKVQVIELTESEFADWLAAVRKGEENLWKGFGGR